ncbi:hypothetical protein, partial [Klebsiella pneumoniae]|uniref:hypothetical protein n=1 Tax=Klebsiella pneumoniae TaxID=573 RepID=UPI00163DDE56
TPINTQQTGDVQRPKTPVAGHQEPQHPTNTVIAPNPKTPAAGHQEPQNVANALRLKTPVSGQQESQQQKSVVTVDDVSEQDRKMFKKYDELSVDEKEKIVDLRNVTIDVEKHVLDPLLGAIETKGTGPTVQYLVAYFNKKDNTALSP